jgi:hypothetical protein
MILDIPIAAARDRQLRVKKRPPGRGLGMSVADRPKAASDY